MNKWLLITTIVLTTAAFAGCDFEDKSVNVCGEKYGSDQIIDSLVRRYHFNNAVYFAQWYKSYLAPKHPNCDTIALVIKSDTIPFSYSDTFAVSVAKVFFNDSVNKMVKCLKIELIDYWPAIAKVETKFLVNRTNLQNTYITEKALEADNMQFNIEEEQPYTRYSSDGKEAGMKIIVRVKKDYKNISKLAAKLRSQYDSTIKEKNLYNFDIDIIVDSLPDRLCTSKAYYFFYTKRNKNI